MKKRFKIGSRRTGSGTRVPFAEWLFYAMILVLPFEDLLTLGGVSIPKLVGLLFFPCSLVQWRAFYGKVPAALLVLLGFVGVGFLVDLCGTQAFDLNLFNEYCKPILLWVLLLAGYNLARTEAFERIVRAVYAASMALALFQTLGLGGNMRVFEVAVDGDVGERFSALGTDPNGLAIFVSLGVLYGIARGLNLVPTRTGHRVLFLLGAMLGYYAVLKSGSRGGLMALGGGIVSLVFSARNLGSTLSFGLVLSCVLAAMGVAVLNNHLLMARFSQKVESSEGAGQVGWMGNIDSAGRFRIWEETEDLVAESPIYGYGAIRQSVELGKRAARNVGDHKVTHNTFLSVLLGTGAIGSLCFLYFYLCALKSVWSARTQSTCGIVFAWYVLLFLGGMSLSLQGMKFFWIVMALSLGAKELQARRLQAAWGRFAA